MGWAIMIGLALLVLAALWRWGGTGRQDLELGGTAMLLALIGYIGWGSPGLAGSPTAARGAGMADMSAADVRKMEANQFSSEGNLLTGPLPPPGCDPRHPGQGHADQRGGEQGLDQARHPGPGPLEAAGCGKKRGRWYLIHRSSLIHPNPPGPLGHPPGPADCG